MTLETKFDIGDKVIYREYDRKMTTSGTIAAFTYSDKGITYAVQTSISVIGGIPEDYITIKED